MKYSFQGLQKISVTNYLPPNKKKERKGEYERATGFCCINGLSASHPCNSCGTALMGVFQ